MFRDEFSREALVARSLRLPAVLMDPSEDVEAVRRRVEARDMDGSDGDGSDGDGSDGDGADGDGADGER